MRGFAVVACSVLVAIAAGVAIIAAGSVPAARTGVAIVAATSVPGDQTAESFAHRVLAEANVPPAARVTSTVVSSFLENPFETPGTGDLIDLHRVYDVDKPPGAVESYLATHLPPGAKIISTGNSSGPGGTATGFVALLPITGPHEYLAQLAYQVAPVGTHAAELRVDGQTVWLPSRSAAEVVPAVGVVDVTGFSKTSIPFGSSGPVTVPLTRVRAAALSAVLDALPLAPSPACHEDTLLYRITIRRTAGSPTSFEADGYACGATVLVTEHGKAMSPLHDADCVLLRTVVSLLPAHKADGTRGSSAGCRS